MDKDSAREILKNLLNHLRYRVPVQRLPKILRELYKETIWEEQANGFTDEAAADCMCWIEKALEIAVKALGEKSEASEPPLILGVLIGLAMRTLFEFMR